MKLTAKTTLCTSIVFLISLFSGADAAVLPKTASLVPPETMLLVDIENFSQLKKQFEKTSLYKFYKDPAMAKFVENAKTKWREKINEKNNEILKAIADANTLPQARLAFALVLNQKAIDSNEPMALFISQWGQNVTKIRQAVEKTVNKAVNEGSHLKKTDYRDVSIKTITAKDSARLGLGFSSKLSYCFIDDCLIGSEDIDVLKFTIARLKGAPSSTLADNPDYNDSLRALGPWHDIDIYLNIKQIIKTTLARDTQNKARMNLTNLGLDNVSAVAVAAGFARKPNSSCNAKMLLKINGAKKGICKMLDLESRGLKAPRFIPASYYSAVFINLNIKKAYIELANVLNSFNPAYALILNFPLTPPTSQDQPPLMLKEALIDHLGSEIVIAQTINKSSTDNQPPTDSLLALAVGNRNEIEKSLSLIHTNLLAANNQDAKRELLGHTIYRIDMGGLKFLKPGIKPMQQAPTAVPAKMPTMAFTVTDTHLVFGTEATVEQVIRTLNSPGTISLASAPWFTAAKLNIPSITGMAAMQDNAASGEFFWKIIKQNASSKQSKSGASISLSASTASPFPNLMFTQSDLFDPTLLPDYEVVRKYFGPSCSYGISRPDGFFFEFNALNANK